MTLRRIEHPHLASFSSSGSASAFNSPLPSHNGFSTRTRLRPGGPLPPPQDNPQLYTNHDKSSQFHRNKNGSLPSFEEIGMKTLAHPTSTTNTQHNGQFLLNRRPYFRYIMPQIYIFGKILVESWEIRGETSVLLVALWKHLYRKVLPECFI